MALQKYFTSKFSYLIISNPTHKTKTGTANRWETTNSKALGPIIMIGKQKRGAEATSYLLLSIALFSASVRPWLCCLAALANPFC